MNSPFPGPVSLSGFSFLSFSRGLVSSPGILELLTLELEGLFSFPELSWVYVVWERDVCKAESGERQERRWSVYLLPQLLFSILSSLGSFVVPPEKQGPK